MVSNNAGFGLQEDQPKTKSLSEVNADENIADSFNIDLDRG